MDFARNKKKKEELDYISLNYFDIFALLHSIIRVKQTERERERERENGCTGIRKKARFAQITGFRFNSGFYHSISNQLCPKHGNRNLYGIVRFLLQYRFTASGTLVTRGKQSFSAPSAIRNDRPTEIKSKLNC